MNARLAIAIARCENFERQQIKEDARQDRRERFAGLAMNGILAGRQAALDIPYVVHRSLEIADALIAKLKEETK